VDKGNPRLAENHVVAAALEAMNQDGRGGKAHLIDDLHLRRFGEQPTILVAHNAKFELGWLWRYNASMRNILPWDTMIAEYVLAGNRPVDLSLDEIAETYGLPGKDPVVDRMMKAGVCPSEMPETWIRQRVLADVRTTMAIAREQYDRLKRAGLLPVFFTRCIFTPVLARLEMEGLHLDFDRVVTEQTAAQLQRRALDERLQSLTGGINIRSRKQLAEFLYDKLGFAELRDQRGDPIRTASGQRSTDAATIAALVKRTREQREAVRNLTEYAKIDGLLSKYLDYFAAAVSKDGRIYGRINQCVTQTHRTSSSAQRIMTPNGERGAQFQNMPRNLKRLFYAADMADRLICELDYAQLEFRVAADLSGDRQALEDIRNGHDVHKFTASVLKNKPIEEVTDKERTEAKPHTFKPLYGGQSGTARERAYYAAFRERYPAIDRMQQEWLGTVLRDKELRIASGLKFYWPDTRVQESGYITNTPSIFNYPVQSFATADIVPIGVTHLFWAGFGMGWRLVNTIHDSAVLEIPATVSTELVESVARENMGDRVVDYVEKVYGHRMQVPLSGEFLIARHWGDKQDSQVRTGKF
jgi:DNA polymerase I-like protein with 3'-5' exonuclease and polymerase domains